jgi:ribosomal protein L12E/L44/L45/RPP1/RPP2
MAKSNRKLKVDMTGVESYTRCSEGEHLAKVKKVEMGTVQGSGDDCIKAVFEVLKGADKGCQVFETFSLSEKALWKLKSFLQAIGIKADGKLTLDLDKLEGKICVIDVVHEEYNGQKRAKISSYLKESAEDEEEDEDDEEEEDDEDEDEEEEAPKSKKSSGKKSAPAKKGKKQPEPEDDDEDDEDEEEEEPPKKSAKKSSKKAAPAKSGKKSKKPEPEEDEDDEDDDWDEDDDD